MEKLDLAKKYKPYFTAKIKPELVDIETAQFISLTGKGDPSDINFSEKIQALYATAYAIKFIHKALGQDFVVSKLECLWWFDTRQFGQPSISEIPQKVNRKEWEFRLLIRMPDYLSQVDLEKSISTVIAKKKTGVAQEIEFVEMKEGMAVQMLHIGPFATEPESLEQMEKFLISKGLSKNGHHHEIYLSDFNKTDPARLKTILRQPVR